MMIIVNIFCLIRFQIVFIVLCIFTLLSGTKIQKKRKARDKSGKLITKSENILLLLAEKVDCDVLVLAVPSVEQGNDVALRLALGDDERRVSLQLVGTRTLACDYPFHGAIVCDDKLLAALGVVGNATNRNRCLEELAEQLLATCQCAERIGQCAARIDSLAQRR